MSEVDSAEPYRLPDHTSILLAGSPVEDGGWHRTTRSRQVEGASGWICLDDYGNPYNKAVAVVQLNARTRNVDFLGKAWPRNGKQPAKDCTATAD